MSVHPSKRIIGTIEGEVPGALLIVTGALHGNEPAGVKALEMVFDALERAKIEQPHFQFKGKMIGLVGNRQAFLVRQRFLDQDLNRCWTTEFLTQSSLIAREELQGELLEVRELFELISNELRQETLGKIVFLDLHTTSAEGGLFCIPTDEGESLSLAKHLGAPAILGLQSSVEGTLLGFAQQGGFTPQNPDSTLPVCIAFESGQHISQQAVFRAASSIVRCLRALGNLGEHDLLDFMESISLPVLSTVPPVVHFRYAHHIEKEDSFKMRPGYVNFQPIMVGEHLADDANGPVLAPESGLILMPLYQAKGSDGFFIVR
ncbi:MAG: succinylglutamate desuccinylase/aspartoacylase family protein [Saprospiraceae bacterium]|nr:succinylglutamate desuccinylase/aspartoacylase family protein [Saprospiraceae bacterium]